jgi:hypothetical protein
MHRPAHPWEAAGTGSLPDSYHVAQFHPGAGFEPLRGVSALSWAADQYPGETEITRRPAAPPARPTQRNQFARTAHGERD